MKRPQRVRVLGKQFAVAYVPAGDDALKNAEGEDCLGMCSPARQTVHVEDGQPLETEQETTLHEVMHAIEDAMGLDLDETVISQMSKGLIAVVKDNPSFVRYLMAKPTR